MTTKKFFIKNIVFFLIPVQEIVHETFKNLGKAR